MNILVFTYLYVYKQKEKEGENKEIYVLKRKKDNNLYKERVCIYYYNILYKSERKKEGKKEISFF